MDKVRFGIVGVGLWGRVHAEVYSTHHLAELRAVCDVDAAKARAVAAEFGAKTVYTDFDEMMRDGNIDAVAVVTPDFAHRGPVVAAARAGKHIIVEKPLATTVEDVEAIAAEVQRAGVQLMVDFHCRWAPPIAVAKQSIENGELGDVVSAYLRLNDTIDVPTRMLRWAGQSSILWFLGSHTVDTLRYLLNDEVRRVYSLSRSGVLRSKGVDVPDIYQSILTFRSGAIATIENNWIVPNTNPSVNDFKINILGSKGMINMDLTHHQLIQRYGESTADHPDCLDGPLIHGKRIGLAYESVRNFVECVARGTPVRVSVEDGANVTRVILAMFESARTEAPVEVNY